MSDLEFLTKYRQAQEKLAWDKQCREYMLAVASAVTNSKCPMTPSAKDYDIFVKQMQEALGELFYDETSEAERIIENHHRADYSAMRQELSTPQRRKA